jgi:hypothetical protein
MAFGQVRVVPENKAVFTPFCAKPFPMDQEL